MNRLGAMSVNLASLPRGARGVLTQVGDRGVGARAGKGIHEMAGGTPGPTALFERMAAMGFVTGTELEVEANYGRGPIIVKIRGARVALGRGQAAKLMVRPLLPEEAGSGGQEPRVRAGPPAKRSPTGVSAGDK